jgi:Rps23 Pro-64 3,4-dihydroxylase Tpa1-like proline 4-hydroxylase
MHATNSPLNLLALNPALDRAALAAQFACHGRIQIRNVLEDASAQELRMILARHTPWGLAWNAGSDGPHSLTPPEASRMTQAEHAQIYTKVGQAAQRGEYAFQYARYPLLDAYLQRWAPDSPHDIVFEHINSEPFLDLVRTITGHPELIKADGQATHYAPSHFLSPHNDSHVAEGWKIAYVLSLAPDDWRPEWGGYLNFLDDDGDIVAGYKPRFNCLNLFRVPQVHHVTFVPPFAPLGRLSITGWFREQ